MISHYELYKENTMNELCYKRQDKGNNNDFIWFANNYDLLVQKYGDCFVAISQKKVIAHGGTAEEARAMALMKAKEGEFFVQECSTTGRPHEAFFFNFWLFR